jgi:hypothetical protein
MAALLMQPAGTTKKMVLGGVVGGAIGAAVAASSQKKGAGTEAGSVAHGFPSPPIVLGATSRRILVWRFSQLRASRRSSSEPSRWRASPV